MSDADLKRFFLEQVRLFESFSADRVDEIVAASRLETYEGNEAIIETGDEGRFLGVVVSGVAEISLTDNTGTRSVIGQLGEGDVFGVLSLMTGERIAADVIAGSRCFVLMIPREIFHTQILTNPKAVAYLSRLLTERTRAMSQDAGKLQRRALANADDPYALSLATDTPGKVVVLNVGISQIHFGIYDTRDLGSDIHGVIDNVDDRIAKISVSVGPHTRTLERPAFPLADLFLVMQETTRLFGDAFALHLQDVTAVGHRVVHGGSKFASSVVITPAVIADIEALSVFAPLHNPVNVDGIRVAMQQLPGVAHVAVFDTAFHQTLPPYAYLYGLPYYLYKQDGIRRYGFHGTSHRYVSLKAAEVLKRPLGELEIVSCHLGIGASVCAIDHGRSVDTTMGMTPTDGLIMPSRSGSIDPAVMIHLLQHHGMSPDQLSNLINTESGMKGISGISSDIAEIEAAAAEGHHRALLAHKAFCYQVRKNIGAYVAAMGGIDVLTFTGDIGETSATVRSLACQGLGYMGIKLDEEKNRNLGTLGACKVISTDDSPVTVLVIANDDERLVAWETLRAIERNELIVAMKQDQADAPIPVEISAHHVHLAQADVEKLFGPGHQLTPEHELSQPGQFACAEKVHLVGPKGRIANVRVLGPTRKETQVEIAMTEQFKLGVQPPIRQSGDLANTPGLTLEGPYGSTTIERGVICAQRHIHMSPEDALRFRVRDNYVVRVRVEGERELIFGDVVVRVNPAFRLAMHIDTDEGNAANIRTGMRGYIEEIQSRY
ncbi:acetate/propionate family kinase [Azoarcus communis]|uniref:Acetate kinase n=1 Tax=Parazoarcus communis SWub3 = DSM 12120 TaxID=1121029 RepID=A0A323UNN9_9RHOO|nr:acetate/propionate family kinase [Parazoarcus communis]NMG50259.1 acetate/propionate family kinase [Parazoarcus communis]NMG71983.1 acetate/propionate family kinase [Parazoarcus communis SWub3 = DSM 12120]PZA14602.1 acetate/propionate family kinase [Azoarcus communis] [Parazoarcus communis SWub3 = DSM 12120]